MKARSKPMFSLSYRLPSFAYLGIAIIVFSTSSSITRKLIEIGQQHLVNGRNPISPCNVLFVGNLCALIIMISIFYRDWKWNKIKQFSRKNWLNLTIVSLLSGAIGPALIFAALDHTTVTNVVLFSRLEPPLTLALNIGFLKARVNRWTKLGSLVSFIGVCLIAILSQSGTISLGKGELQVILATVILSVASVIGKSHLQNISLGIFITFRTLIGTIVFFGLANFLYGSEHFSEAFSPFLWEWMLIYAAIIVVAGQLSWLRGLKKASIAQITLANSLNPIVAILMAYLILGEVPTMAQYLGGSIIFVGILLSFRGSLAQSSEPVKMMDIEMMGTLKGI